MTQSKINAADSYLPLVAKPGRYRSNFLPSDPGRFESARLRVAVVHPDLFEPGFSDPVTRDAHAALNAFAGVAADLAFLPWPDLEDLLRSNHRPLWGIETGRPLNGFDVIVLTPREPLQFANVIRLLDAMALPRVAADRATGAPLVVAAGDAMLNPMPLADALDAALLGDPWAVMAGLAGRAADLSAADHPSLDDRRAALAGLPGVLPLHPGPTAAPVRPVALEPGARPEPPAMVPLVQPEDDAWPLVVMRGGERPALRGGWSAHETPSALAVDRAVESAARAIEAGGFERVRLTGDRPFDHPDLARVAEGLMRRHPSLIVALDDFGQHQPSPPLARELLRGRRVTLTWSPGAGSGELRRRMGLELDDAPLLDAVSTAARGGASTLVFRFTLGWPGESVSDHAAIAELVSQIRGRITEGSSPRVTIELSPFVPRPHTPHERAGFIAPGAWDAALAGLRRAIESGPVQFRPASYEMTRLDAALARADRTWFRGLEAVVAAGGRTPMPTEPWSAEPWLAALAGAGFELREAGEPISPGDPVPWSIVDLTQPPEVVDIRGRLAAPVGRAEAAAPADSLAFGRRNRRRPAGAAAPRQSNRYRIRYSKDERLRYTAHLDVGKAIERAFRRMGIGPAVRGKGVQLSFGPPLPLGWTSDDEYFDIEFAQDVPETTPAMLAELLPPGFQVEEIRPVRVSVESLSQSIDRADYRVTFPADLQADLEAAAGRPLAECLRTGIDWALTAARIEVSKNPADPSVTIDVRPGLRSAEVMTVADGGTELRLGLTIGQPGSARPDIWLPLLLRGVNIDARRARIHRLALRISGADKTFSPLEVVEANFPWWREAMKKNASGPRP